MRNAKLGGRSVSAFCVLNLVLCISSCSIPNLETPQCAAARDVAKQYYSLAIGGDPMSHPDVLARLKVLRSANFSAGPASDGDPFYFSSAQPTSSRVGQCSLLADGKVRAEVTVIWLVNDRHSERKDDVTLAKMKDGWLIERIDVGTQPKF